VRIEDYALIGDTQTAALVAANGSIDWLCLPRFDSGACFAAILGDAENGHWRIAPVGPVKAVRRRYRPGTLVLETEFETDDGTVRLVDCMPIRDRTPDLARLVEGVTGRVPMCMQFVLRFDYGCVVPWVRQVGGALRAVAGPDGIELVTPIETRGEDFRTVAEFTVGAGEQVPFLLRWHPSHELAPPPLVVAEAVADTQAWWEDWSRACGLAFVNPTWDAAVRRSLITLKALTYAPTGGIVAAPTTSLPEQLGGVRNWDYRFCWVRDATLTLYALLEAGYTAEAAAWRDWLLRAVAGEPSKLQIMYGCAGERRLTECELDHLAGYENSRPVRIGNAASEQFQLDVYGEVLDVMLLAARVGMSPDPAAWAVIDVLLDFLEGAWRQPDDGIWEVRGPRRHFTHSKMMAWVAMDRAVRLSEDFSIPGPVDSWRRTRDAIHAEVCGEGYNADLGTFTQYYGGSEVDAALLQMPLVGFLPADDVRVKGTVAAIERTLLTPSGFVLRYRSEASSAVDGLPPGEGCFLPCSFWLADAYAMEGRNAEATALFEMLLGLVNDVGLLAEEYDPVAERFLGNFPQAFSHVALVNTARNVSGGRTSPARHRSG
jgi:GH15 family glucan-1,4-alpha-glucosidase